MAAALINTGEPRNVTGHIVSGAVASAIVWGTLNYKKSKEQKISSNEAVKDTVKKTSQGAIATGAAIATANYLGQKDGFIKALSAASVGMLGIYAVEKLSEKLEQNCQTNENDQKLVLEKSEDEQQ